MRARTVLRETAALLTKSGVPSPDREAEAIILHCAGLGRIVLLTDDPPLTRKAAACVEQAIARRQAGEPLQYILGTIEFSGIRIRVGRGVLIPRHETELLVEEVVSRIRVSPFRDVLVSGPFLDLCTGSGCIGLALAARFRSATVFGTEHSESALGYARENARINALDNVRMLPGSLFGPVSGMQFRVIVSNPPYIKSSDIAGLQVEVRAWEPLEALDGGADGLVYYREIIGGLRSALAAPGLCVLEIGYDQREAVERLAAEHGFVAEFKRDYAGLDRICIITS